MCDRPVSYFEITNDDPGCPAMFTPVVGGIGLCPYFGLVSDEDGETMLIVCCSEPCVQRLVTK